MSFDSETWGRRREIETSLGTPASVKYPSFPLTVTLLSVRGRDARRFFDSTPGVSQPGDGFQVACCSLPSVVLGAHELERGRQMRVPRVWVRAPIISKPTRLVNNLRTRRTWETRRREETTNARSWKMRKARDARDRQVTRSRWNVKEFTFRSLLIVREVCVPGSRDGLSASTTVNGSRDFFLARSIRGIVARDPSVEFNGIPVGIIVMRPGSLCDRWEVDLAVW